MARMMLDELVTATQTDRTRIPELVAVARRLLADDDAQTRTDAAAVAFYAVRQLLPALSMSERATLCEAMLVELDAAIARGLIGPTRGLANVLHGVLVRVITKPLEFDELYRGDRDDAG